MMTKVGHSFNKYPISLIELCQNFHYVEQVEWQGEKIDVTTRIIIYAEIGSHDKLQ